MAERLKILFLTAWYPSQQAPLAGPFVREHAKAARVHDDVVVLHSAARDLGAGGFWKIEQETDEALTEGIPTYRARARRLGPFSYVARLWGIEMAYRRIVADGFRPDIIHANVYPVGLPAVLLGRLHRTPTVLSEHSSEFQRRALSPMRLAGARLAFQQAQWVLPVSRSLQQAIEAYGIRARFLVVPNVVDTRLFRPGITPEEQAGTRVLLFIGSLDKDHKKGVPFLLQALAQVGRQRSDWRLEVFGAGPALAEYRQLSAELGIGEKVGFRGPVSRREVAVQMQRCSFFVLPSLHETFGVVLIEALATGKPVLATLSGGPDEIVTPEVGLLVPPGDAGALAVAIDYLLDHYKEYLSSRLVSYVQQRFSYEAVGRQLDCVYRSMLIRGAR